MAYKTGPSRKKIKKEIKKTRTTARARRMVQSPVTVANTVTALKKRKAVKKKKY
jgi:Mn-dependent DtxR family transcriptional regulator